MKNTFILIGLTIFCIYGFSQETGSFTDIRDGKVYKTVKIGTQWIMAENFAYKTNSGNYWAYDNDSRNVEKYGYLYDWKTAKKVCPTGWHLPTDAEWTTLTDVLGGESIAGGKLKETGTTHWGSPNAGATNETGFTALPGGNRNLFGQFQYIGDVGRYWSSTDSTKSINDRVGDAWFRDIYARDGKIGRNISTEVAGFSVRCIRD